MVKECRELVEHSFKGGRFEDHGLDIQALPELVAYRNLLLETAKELWRQAHPGRERLPSHFDEKFTLKFTELRTGSVAVPLLREFETEEQRELWDSHDELSDAAELLNEAIQAATESTTLPERFPKRLLGLFVDYGRTLRPDEYFELRIPDNDNTAAYTQATRERLISYSESTYEDQVDLIGAVTMARVSKPKMALELEDGTEIEATFPPSDEQVIVAALKDHSTAKLQVRGRGQFKETGELQRISEVHFIRLLPGGEVPFDDGATPIWDIFAQVISQVPAEELDVLPTDAAAEHDHYIYGTPKRG